MIIKQAFCCDTDDCMYYDTQEEGCEKGSIKIQEGCCCDYEKRRATPETQSRDVGAKITDPHQSDHAREYTSGADMWHDYKARYGIAETRGICNRYLDMQVHSKNQEELQFCKELYAAMASDPDTSEEE